MNFILSKLIFISLLLSLVGCNRTGEPVLFIIPNGFQGAIQIIFDGKSNEGYQHINGRHEYTIPPNGVLHVQSDTPFREWHVLSVQTLGGQQVPLEDTGGYASGTIVVKTLITKVRNNGPETTWYAVGTSEYIGRLSTWVRGSRYDSPPTPTTQSIK